MHPELDERTLDIVHSLIRTARAVRSRKFISRSNGSSRPFVKIHQPFERLEPSVRENSSAVRTARAIRSRKFISRLNGSRYPFEKDHQQFERLEPSVRENSSAVRTSVGEIPDFKTVRQACQFATHAVMFTLRKQSSRFCSLFTFA